MLNSPIKNWGQSVLIANIPVHIFKDLSQLTDYILADNGDIHYGSAIAINPEKIVKAIDSSDVRDILLNASIRYPDGIGVVKTIARKSRLKVNRIPGVELWENLMAKAGKLGTSVYIIGGTQDVVCRAAAKMRSQYSTPISGFRNGYYEDEQEVIQEIKQVQPKIVCVALGSPAQEKFINRCRIEYPFAFYMGIGGSLDVYTGKVTRAPLLFRKLNLEWLYRLIAQPTRIVRQINLLRYLVMELQRKL